MSTTPEALKVHKKLTIDIEVGDYVCLPFVPVVKVINKIKSKGVVILVVQAGANPPEEWKIEVEAEVIEEGVQQVKQQEVAKYLVYTATPYYRQVVVNSRKPKTKAQRRATAILR